MSITVKHGLFAIFLLFATIAFGLEGHVVIHDPSTVVWCDGKLYTYGTGGSSLVSDDGWTWRSGTPLPRRGLAPDVIHIGDRYYVYVAANIGAQPKAAVNMIWSKTLDPLTPVLGNRFTYQLSTGNLEIPLARRPRNNTRFGRYQRTRRGSPL